MDTHLAKCNQRPRLRQEDFFSRDINLKSCHAPNTCDRNLTLVELIEFMRPRCIIPTKYVFKENYQATTGKSGRHTLQNELICRIINDQLGTEKGEVCFVELGAGKGNFSKLAC